MRLRRLQMLLDLRQGPGAVPRIGRSHLHPFLERRDLVVGELAVRRHLQVVALILDRLDDERLRRITSHEGRAGVAPLQHARLRVEQQAPLLVGVGGVAVVAVVDEDRPDLRLEERDGIGTGGGRRLLGPHTGRHDRHRRARHHCGQDWPTPRPGCVTWAGHVLRLRRALP